MFEVELKARIRDRSSVVAALAGLCVAGMKEAVYDDTYFDSLDRALSLSERELRLRTVTGDVVRHILTYKETPFDKASRSKPEYETSVDDPEAVKTMLAGLGYRPRISFVKKCLNASVRYQDNDVLVTLVRMPELGTDFIELEIMVGEQERTEDAFRVLYDLADRLGICRTDMTSEYYSDMIRKARNGDRE